MALGIDSRGLSRDKMIIMSVEKAGHLGLTHAVTIKVSYKILYYLSY